MIYIFLVFGYIIFIFNIWLINRGSGFTIPREMLFRNYADLKLPILVFPIILLLLSLIIVPFFKNYFKKINIFILISFLTLISFSLFFTVQTNPDYGIYQYEAKYLAENGLFSFLNNWGNINCTFNMPLHTVIRGLSFKIFGDGPIAIILVNILFVLGILYFTYRIAKELFDESIARISIVLLATTPFFITQTHLFLADIGLTFFVTLSIYLTIKLINESKMSLAILLGLILFSTAMFKVFGVLFLTSLFFASLIYWYYKSKQFLVLKYLGISWGLFVFLSFLFVIWKLDSFRLMIFQYSSPEKILMSFLPLLIIGISAITVIFLVKNNLANIRKILKKINFSKYLPIIIYAVLIFLFFFGKRSLFYLRTIFIAFNIPLAFLFFSSIWLLIKKKDFKPLILLIITATVFFIPNTMFKYQLPTYPAIVVLASYSLVSFFKTEKIKYLAVSVILSFSVTITYFFYLPMIQTHVKNNIRKAVSYANDSSSDEIAILFFPLGDYGEMLQRSIDHIDACPHPPSLVDIIDFYTKANVFPTSRDELISGSNLPKTLFLVYHLDIPKKEDPELQKFLIENYNEGNLFDQFKGSGIWRVKIEVFSLE